ncbi:MAG: translocation/assembly module TamB domain-containing protein, partial [Rectinemataceae bacterium]
AGALEVGSLRIGGKGYGLSGSLKATYGDLRISPQIALDATMASDDNPLEKYSVNVAYTLGVLDARVIFGGFPLERYIEASSSADAVNGLKGALEGSISIQGPFDFASLDLEAMDWNAIPPTKFEAKIVGGEYRAIPVTMMALGSLENGVLQLSLPIAEYLAHRAENIEVTVELDKGRADLAFDYKTVIGNALLEAGIVADVRMDREKSTEADTGPSESGSPSIQFSGKLLNVKYRETFVDRWGFSGTYGDGNIALRGDDGTLSAAIGSGGAFEILLRDKFPITANIKGTMSGNVVAAAVENVEINLKKIGTLLPGDKIQLLDGVLSGNLNLKGPIADPEINGELTLKKVKVRSTELVTGELGPFGTTISFAGKNIEMAPTLVPLENGTIELSASGLLDQWVLTDLKFNVASQKDSVVNLTTKIAGITVIDAKAKIDMIISLDNDVIVAQGSVYFERGQVYINPQGFLPESAAPENENALAFRIKADMSFGKQLEVYLPDNKIPILRGFTAPGSFLTLQFDSNSQDFSLEGKIDLRTGYVLYYLRSFFLKSGSIEFSENSTKFNPLITAEAELRESNALGTVKIMLNAERSPLDNLNPRLSSVPLYSETELIAIMSGGVLAADTKETLDIREAAIASSEFLPQLNIFKRFEQEVQKALGLDIVFIRSSFIQRWLLDLTKPLTEANPEDPLARYLNQSELYVGKYLTDSAFLHAGLKLREDPLVSSSRLRLDSEFGIELDAPFGLINWSITPSMDEGSLVTGQELSLSWRYVY